jgi:exodeoxyribonuclease III
MRILSWNIRQGGGSRVDGIINALLEHDADVIGLAECKANSNLIKLRKVMGDSGWVHQSIVEPENGQYTLLVLSRLPFKIVNSDSSIPFVQCRWQKIINNGSDVRVLFAHVPDYVKPITGISRKEIFWQYLVEHAKQHLMEKTLLFGDFNTGLPIDGPGFRCVKYFKELLGIGYKDMWREFHPGTTEFTWHSLCNGFRLDHAFASPVAVPSFRNAYYSHRERETGISDHSILIVDLFNP